jgi:AraC-like DNA-binding protein
VAALCELGPRTLMRRLAAEGRPFRPCWTRPGRRALWLRHTRLPVEEVAAQLGLADTSNFSRTVRRWFGCTPGDCAGDVRRP